METFLTYKKLLCYDKIKKAYRDLNRSRHF